MSALVAAPSAISSQSKLSDSFHCAESGNPTACPVGPCLKQGLVPGIGTWLLRRLHDLYLYLYLYFYFYYYYYYYYYHDYTAALLLLQLLLLLLLLLVAANVLGSA